ncbi:MAG: Grx4 family monothiol glutaredoxin [Gammaproteobacteria bacterium]|nr:Grx4 family monothiol glutaredoxin [Gammaproteobacteria bacterium]
MTVQERIQQQLRDNPIVLYMKGTPELPQCGFSSRAINILRQCGADYLTVNVLEDSEIREGIKAYGNWPTIPQLYINGELIGGSDIMSELLASGELQTLLTKVEQ